MAALKDYKTQLDRLTAHRFVVACEGQRSEEIYLSFMTDNLRRVELLPLSTGKDGRSAPRHLLERLRDWKSLNASSANRTNDFWMVLDTDHHFLPNHAPESYRVLSEAQQAGIQVAISNPRFELWLLLHLESVTICSGDYCETRLKTLLGGYNHGSYNPQSLQGGLGNAIGRAQQLDTSDKLPPNPGTRLHNLMLAVLNA